MVRLIVLGVALLAGAVVWATGAAAEEAGVGYRTGEVRTVEGRTGEGIAYYGEEPPDEYARERCRLDVSVPGGGEGFTTVVWFHAGGLVGGERYVPGELKAAGLGVVAVDYRLSPRAKAPAYIEDAAAAVAWVFENIEAYGGSPDRVVVAGASAGGYLAMMVTLDKGWLAAHGVDADRVLGIGSLGGQAITHVAVRQERGIDRTTTVVDELAPMHHARGDAPPLLLVTGDREKALLGRYEECDFMRRMMVLNGHERTELFEVVGADHAGVERGGYPIFLEFIAGL